MRRGESLSEILGHYALPVRVAVLGTGNDIGVRIDDGFVDIAGHILRLPMIIRRCDDPRCLCSNIAEVGANVTAGEWMGRVVTGTARQAGKEFLPVRRISGWRGRRG